METGLVTLITPCFTSPETVGGLATSDPLDPTVIAWYVMRAPVGTPCTTEICVHICRWKAKVAEIMQVRATICR